MYNAHTYVTIFYTKKIYNSNFCHSLPCFSLCLCYELTLFIPIYHKQLNWYLYIQLYVYNNIDNILFTCKRYIYFMKKKTNKTFYTFCQLDMQSYTWIVIIYYGFASSVPHFISYLGKKLFSLQVKTDYYKQSFCSLFFNCQIESRFGTTTKSQFMSAFNDWALIF